ncbi:hypothetical protein V8B97DRAFT_2024586 [Scleroderma yunnanense]
MYVLVQIHTHLVKHAISLYVIAMSQKQLINKLASLSVKEIFVQLKGVFTFSQEERQNKELLLEKVISCTPQEQVEFLCDLALEKEAVSANPLPIRKVIEEEPYDNEENGHDPSKYLALPTEGEQKGHYHEFYEATSSAALTTGICDVCTRKCGLMMSTMVHILLQPEAVNVNSPYTQVSICQVCLNELWKPGNTPPQYSLANNLWIGCIPWQLQSHVFILKLFPKQQDGICQASGLQNAMQGNVSTYDMSMDGITEMIQGNLMPRQCITVQCKAVHNALLWLKENNPCYADIEISSSHLDKLPEDNILQKVMNIIQQSENVSYVPQDDDKTSSINTDMLKVIVSELIAWGLANLWKEGKEGGYFVQHGQQPINDVGHPCTTDKSFSAKWLNSFVRAFPGLFPYGQNDIEGKQEVTMDFGEHIHWAMHYHDHQFQRHPTFSFVAFGIMQHCQVLLDAQLLSALTLERLEMVQEAEEKNIPIINPAVAKTHIFTGKNINLHDLWKKLVEATTQWVHNHMGIFKNMMGYFGLVKSQGRGALHLHLLVWLKNTPISGKIEKLLSAEDFHQQICKFIKENICAYIPGFESAEVLKKIPNDVEVAYSHSPNPQSPNYNSEIHHTCKMWCCLVLNKTRQWVCKQCCGMKRLYGYINTWVPRTTINAHCNNDIKLLTNSREMTNISFYIMMYLTKKQGKSYNLSAIMAKAFIFHTK